MNVFAAANCKSFAALCREFGITRRTGYKWVSRASAGETASGRFVNRSTAPKNVANKTPAEIERLILECRDENPAWGGKTIHRCLKITVLSIYPV